MSSEPETGSTISRGFKIKLCNSGGADNCCKMPCSETITNENGTLFLGFILVA